MCQSACRDCESCQRLMVCMFCGGGFAELAFFGCCSSCFVSNPKARGMVEESTPQTDAFASTKHDAFMVSR